MFTFLMEEKSAPTPQPPRYTFSVIHDDEFRPITADDIDVDNFRTDFDDWRDTWKKRPPEVFRNQIRAAPGHN